MMTLSVRVQRLIVMVAVVATVLTAVYWPRWHDRAAAETLSDVKSNYLPFNCNNSSTTDNRRESLQLDDGNGEWDASGYVYPCISGVLWQMSAGNVNNSAGSQFVAKIGKVFARQAVSKAGSGQPLYWASSGSRSDLYQLSFANLQFCTSTTAPISNCLVPGTDANSPKLVLRAASANTQSDPKPKTDYTLDISPDAAATIGGNGVTTELWVTGDSSFAVPNSQVPCIGIKVGSTCIGLGGSSLCALVGTVHGSNCQIKMSTFGSNLVQLLAAGSDWNIVGLDIYFYYLVSHTPNPSNPYATVPSTSSIVLPNTTISVQ